MAVESTSVLSCFTTSVSSPLHSRKVIPFQLSYSRESKENLRCDMKQVGSTEVIKSSKLMFPKLNLKERILNRQIVRFAISEDQVLSTEGDDTPITKEEDQDSYAEELSPVSISSLDSEGTDGKPGLISFYNRPYRTEDPTLPLPLPSNQTSLLWFVGPAILVGSFILPSLYLRKIISAVFEDSLLTDFLILFFTEALFYGGVAIYLLLTDHLCRPVILDSTGNTSKLLPSRLVNRIASGAVLALSLITPMVTMGLVWPWTGPAASATLAPYLVGIVVQFAFEQYARRAKLVSWPVIPVVFQIYRLHQLNRAAQLVTALSFTIRGAEMTAHNMAISRSLGTLLNVLQFLGVVCIWSLSSFIMRFFPSTTMIDQ